MILARLLARLIALSIALVLACGADAATPLPKTLDGERMGTLRLFAPSGAPTGFVYLVSDEAGWNAALDKAAADLAGRGAVVAGVDLPAWLDGLRKSDDEDCHYLGSELEDFSHRIQRQLGIADYQLPIVAGVGAGATLAYAALAQAPEATLAGAASLDMRPALATRLKLCEGAPAIPAEGGGGFGYGVATTLPGWWRVAFTAPATATLDYLVASSRQTERVEVPAGSDAAAALAALVAPRLGDLGMAAGEGSMADLPLDEIPATAATASTPLIAIILSGDGGWRDLDRSIGTWLGEQGVPVVGLDSLRYFWRQKSPDELARALERIIEHYSRSWRAQKVALVGYSFGADVLPFAYSRLRPDIKARVVQLSFLGFSRNASFEIEVTGWLGFGAGGDAPSTVAEMKTIDPALVQCIYGEEEEDTACLDPALAKTELIKTKGGHHFDGDYDALAKKILEGAHRRGGG